MKRGCNGVSIDLMGPLLIIFIVLKVTGTVDWGWLWVLSPLWLPLVIILTVLVVILLIVGIYVSIKLLIKRKLYKRGN